MNWIIELRDRTKSARYMNLCEILKIILFVDKSCYGGERNAVIRDLRMEKVEEYAGNINECFGLAAEMIMMRIGRKIQVDSLKC